MIVAAFKFKVNPEFQEEFDTLYGHANKHVAKIEGYEGHEVFSGQDGHHMVVVHFTEHLLMLGTSTQNTKNIKSEVKLKSLKVTMLP